MMADAMLPFAWAFHHGWRLRRRESRQADWPIGSDTVEAACKVVVQQRMKQAGLQWGRTGVQGTLTLRCLPLSGRCSLLQPAHTPA